VGSSFGDGLGLATDQSVPDDRRHEPALKEGELHLRFISHPSGSIVREFARRPTPPHAFEFGGTSSSQRTPSSLVCLGHALACALAPTLRSSNDPIGTDQEFLRDLDAQFVRHAQIDDEINLRYLLDG